MTDETLPDDDARWNAMLAKINETMARYELQRERDGSWPLSFEFGPECEDWT